MSGGGERIVKTGHDAQHGHRINEEMVERPDSEEVVEQPDPVIGKRGGQNYKKDQDDLGSRGELAVDAGRKRPVPGHQQNHDRDNEDQHVPAENEDSEPPGELLLEREDDEGRREQKLVGDGIEISAEGGSLIQTTRE